jgi:hypothetical protein
MQANQQLMDQSKRIKLNRLQFEKNGLTNSDGEMNSKVSGDKIGNYGLSHLNVLSNKSSYVDESSPQQYHNFHEIHPNSNVDVLDSEEFNYNDTFLDTPSLNRGGMNPMYNNSLYTGGVADKDLFGLDDSEDPANRQLNTNPLNTIDRSKMRSMPCYAAMRNSCDNPRCGYSHDSDLLQREWDRKNKEMQSSPFARYKGAAASSPADQRRSSPARTPS